MCFNSTHNGSFRHMFGHVRWIVKLQILKAFGNWPGDCSSLDVYFSPGPFLALTAGQERSNPTHVKAIEHPGGR
jgi:hypothetical protein